MKKLIAHKNECRGAARQIVKSISKTATSIIAAVDRFMTAEAWCILALCDVAAIGFLVRLGGI